MYQVVGAGFQALDPRLSVIRHPVRIFVHLALKRENCRVRKGYNISFIAFLASSAVKYILVLPENDLYSIYPLNRFSSFPVLLLSLSGQGFSPV
jgi:hypothetical protein